MEINIPKEIFITALAIFFTQLAKQSFNLNKLWTVFSLLIIAPAIAVGYEALLFIPEPWNGAIKLGLGLAIVASGLYGQAKGLISERMSQKEIQKIITRPTEYK